MCVAVPGRVLSLEGKHAMVDFMGNVTRVRIGAVDAKLGDYVLVHAGYAVQIVAEDHARELEELLSAMEQP